jgi:hypothetical protein
MFTCQRCRQIIHNTIINKDYKVAATSSQTIIDPGPPDLLAESELNAESGVTFQLSTQAALAASYAGPAPIQRRIIHPIARYHPISSATTNDDQYDQLNVDYYQAASSVIEYLCTAGHPLDHPLCQECAETITARLSQQLEDIELECCLFEEQLPNDSTDHSVALANSESEATAEEIVEVPFATLQYHAHVYI